MLTRDLKDSIRAFNDLQVEDLRVGAFNYGVPYGVHAEPEQPEIRIFSYALMSRTVTPYFGHFAKMAHPSKASPQRTLETPERASKSEFHPSGSTFSRSSTATASTKDGKIMSTD
jgi:hypothetical protein